MSVSGHKITDQDRKSVDASPWRSAPLLHPASKNGSTTLKCRMATSALPLADRIINKARAPRPSHFFFPPFGHHSTSASNVV